MDGPPSLGISLRTGRHFRPRPFLLDVAGDALKRFGATVIRWMCRRDGGRAVQRQGAIVAVPILLGLHHCYSRI